MLDKCIDFVNYCYDFYLFIIFMLERCVNHGAILSVILNEFLDKNPTTMFVIFADFEIKSLFHFVLCIVSFFSITDVITSCHGAITLQLGNMSPLVKIYIAHCQVQNLRKCYFLISHI